MKSLLEALQIFAIFIAAVILAICIGLVFFGIINAYTVIGAVICMFIISKLTEE